MAFTSTLPTEVGVYRHRWQDALGVLREQVLFVGYTNTRAPGLQGAEPNRYMPRKLRCCKPDQCLHADRLTPAEWGGWWERVSEGDREALVEMPANGASVGGHNAEAESPKTEIQGRSSEREAPRADDCA